MTAYREMLKHPKWQRKRLEVLERDDFTCRYCFDKDSPLHAHHTYYVNFPRIAPWEYPADSIITLCGGCHELAHMDTCTKSEFKKYLMMRHTESSMSQEAMDYFFMKHELKAA